MVCIMKSTVVIELIFSTDSVIWIGDFNYRIGLGSDKVKQLIKNNDLETLYENDQVITPPTYLQAGLTYFS